MSLQTEEVQELVIGEMQIFNCQGVTQEGKVRAVDRPAKPQPAGHPCNRKSDN